MRFVIEDNRADFALEKAQAGTGIGTSIMKQQAAEIGADFHLHSQSGKGTRVEITLPAGTNRPGGSLP